MSKKYVVLIMFAMLAVFSVDAYAQRNKNYHEYIKKYSDMAVDLMKEHRIPASIILAQGLLESGAGRSKLARENNNHFGIKCGSAWKGKKCYHDDDAKGECFRAYKSAKDSYEDHSRFLTKGARYAFLFTYDITDYKRWARGLKKAGYATDPSYANRLITIIEDYNLYEFDQKGKKKSKKSSQKEPEKPVFSHQVYLANDMAYIIARKGDTFKSIGKEFDVSWKKLIKYNDLHKGYTLTDSDIIYLCKKQKKASKEYPLHIVKDGDSMHYISQIYGIRLKELYKMNRKDSDYVPEIGDRLRLR